MQFVYAKDPLVLESPPGDANAEKFAIVANHMVAHINGFIGLDNRWTLFGSLPVNLDMSGTHVSGVPDADGAGLGDPTLGFRLKFLEDENPDRGRLALQLAAELPLGHAASPGQSYSGGRQLAFVPQLLGDIKAGTVRLAVAVGGRLVKGDAVLLRQPLEHQLTAAVGAIAPLTNQFSLHGEIFGSTYTADAFARSLTPIEGLVGAKYAPSDPWRVGLAIGAGLTRGIGSPDVRVIASLGYVFQPTEPVPAVASSVVPAN